MTTKPVSTIMIILLLFLTACSLVTAPPAPTSDPDVLVAQALAQTQQFQTQVALAAQLTMAASGGGALPPPPAAALPTYTFQPTYTFHFTETLSTVTVTVSIDTNCRTGPGTAYPIVGALVVGQTAEVVGKSRTGDNWIVKLPGKTTTCWLWEQYATVTDNSAGLPIIEPPPVPATVTPSTINITIFNKCSETIYYAYIADVEDPDWGTDELGASTILVGGTYTWIYNPGTYGVKVENSTYVILYVWFNLVMTTDQYLVACP